MWPLVLKQAGWVHVASPVLQHFFRANLPSHLCSPLTPHHVYSHSP